MDHSCFRSRHALRSFSLRLMSAGLILTSALSGGCSLFLEEPPLFNAEQDGQLPVEEDAIPPFVPPPPLDARLELDRQAPDRRLLPAPDARAGDAQAGDAQANDAGLERGSPSSDGGEDLSLNEDQRVDLG